MKAYRQTLNRANREFNKTKKLNELIVDYMYPLKAIKSVTTKYGLRKVVTLEEDQSSSCDQLIEVFLPPRFNATMFDMNYIHYLVYHGKKPMKKGEEFNDIEFMVTTPVYNNNIQSFNGQQYPQNQNAASLLNPLRNTPVYR